MAKVTKKMNVWQLTMLTAANMLGAGIIMLPTKLAQVGTISVLSWLVTAVGSLLLAHVFAQCGMFTRHSGGIGGRIRGHAFRLATASRTNCRRYHAAFVGGGCAQFRRQPLDGEHQFRDGLGIAFARSFLNCRRLVLV